jgi:hypothetical protein
MSDMVGELYESFQNSIDFAIISKIPQYRKKKNHDSELEIPLIITAHSNAKLDYCVDYLIETLEILNVDTATNQKIETAPPFYEVTLHYKSHSYNFTLKDKLSIELLKEINKIWRASLDNFQIKIDNNTFSPHWNGVKDMRPLYPGGEEWRETLPNSAPIWNIIPEFQPNDKNIVLSFPSEDDIVGITKWNHQISDFNSIPNNISITRLKPKYPFKNGGRLLYEKENHGLVCSLIHFDNLNWYDAMSKSENLEINGCNDWRLPTIQEVYSIGINMHNGSIIENPFWYQKFWTCTEVNKNYAWIESYLREAGFEKTSLHTVIFVRSF